MLVQAHPATLVCGGADDSHYDLSSASDTLRLDPRTAVQVLAAGNAGFSYRAIASTALPAWLPHAESRIFKVVGPPNAVTALTEQYHP